MNNGSAAIDDFFIVVAHTDRRESSFFAEGDERWIRDTIQPKTIVDL